MAIAGATATGGNAASGGVTQIGGASSSVTQIAAGGQLTGGTSASGGTSAAGGAIATGGATTSGGTLATGGASAAGTSTIGGTSATGGAIATGGTTSSGGTSATGGATLASTGGITATGGSSGSSGSISVRSHGLADAPQQSQLVLQVSVCNVGSASVNLQGYTLNYWYTEDTASLAQMANVDMSTATPAPTVTATQIDENAFRVDATSVLTLKFGATTLSAGSCTGSIQIRIWSANYTCCYAAQQGDYSYSAATTLSDNQRITAYNAQGQLIWGVEPALAQ